MTRLSFVLRVLLLGGLVPLVVHGCGNSGSPAGGAGAGHGGFAGAGGPASGTAGSGSGSAGVAGPGAAGMMMGKPGPMGMAGQGGALATTCTPGVEGSAIIDCGYPATSSNPLTSVVFNESEVLRAIQPSGGPPTGIVRLFYNDEHALTLGVRQVVVKSASGTTMTDYPVSPLTANPGSVTNAQTGTNALAGDQSGLDQSLRPMWPVLYITDITSNANSRAGDWQQGGRPVGPTEVFGTWKAAVRNVDTTTTPNTVSITPDADPAKNAWNLGGGDPAPTGLKSEGYGAEVRWNVALTAGHSYRIQVIVHDGDQNKAGGDSGEACVVFCAGAGGGEGTGGTGGSQPPPPACPAGEMACGLGTDIDPVSCPAGDVCANGCCSYLIP
jgi:hypothetical protein